jgi:hypothetical protein
LDTIVQQFTKILGFAQAQASPVVGFVATGPLGAPPPQIPQLVLAVAVLFAHHIVERVQPIGIDGHFDTLASASAIFRNQTVEMVGTGLKGGVRTLFFPGVLAIVAATVLLQDQGVVQTSATVIALDTVDVGQ